MKNEVISNMRLYTDRYTKEFYVVMYHEDRDYPEQFRAVFTDEDKAEGYADYCSGYVVKVCNEKNLHYWMSGPHLRRD